jgi:hypothetical protein
MKARHSKPQFIAICVSDRDRVAVWILGVVNRFLGIDE